MTPIRYYSREERETFDALMQVLKAEVDALAKSLYDYVKFECRHRIYTHILQFSVCPNCKNPLLFEISSTEGMDAWVRHHPFLDLGCEPYAFGARHMGLRDRLHLTPNPNDMSLELKIPSIMEGMKSVEY